jgi:DNA-binding FrmR family transcriptional regulator
MSQSNTAQSDPIISKLKRVRGQLDGIIRMYEDERGCIDIVRQVAAARSGLSGVARDLLTSEASRCSRENRVDDLEEILKELFKK